MDRGQKLDVVGTPAKDRSYWLSIEDFQKSERILPWREFQPGIYKVLEIHDPGWGKFWPSALLKLESKNGETFFAWAMPSMVFAIENIKKSTFTLNSGSKTDIVSLFFDFNFIKHIYIQHDCYFPYNYISRE